MKKIIKKILPKRILIIKSKIYQSIQARRDGISYQEIFQLAPTTYSDRHPDLFKYCQNYFDNKKNIKILSYGCSTGEETLSIRKYFPEAIIFGCDINRKSLKYAQQNNSDSNIYYFFSDNENIHFNGPFDLIFSLSVFCKEPEARNVDNLSDYFPFEKFNGIIKLLHKNLNKNGLFVIRNSNYLFEDSDISLLYRIIKFTVSGFPLFDKKGNKKNEESKRGEIFAKD